MIKQTVNSYQTPNSVIDEYLHRISGSALKCYSLIARRTKGWGKEIDFISLSEFEKACGLSRHCIIKACKELEDIDLVIKMSINKKSIWALKPLPQAHESLLDNTHESTTVPPIDQPPESSAPPSKHHHKPKQSKAISATKIDPLLKGMPEEDMVLAQSFLKYRKIIKKPIKTQTSLLQNLRWIKSSAVTHNKTIDWVLEQMAVHEWRAGKPEYFQNILKPNGRSKSGLRPSTFEQMKAMYGAPDEPDEIEAKFTFIQ